MYLSASSMKDWLDCPQKLGYRLAGKEQEPNAYLVRGIVVHEILEDQTITTYEEARKVFFTKFSKMISEWEAEFPYRTSFSSMSKQANQMLDNYYNIINVTEPPVKEAELFFEVEIRGITFKGKIDQIRGNSIYDWKTATKDLDNVTQTTDYQFTLYGMAYKELFGEYPENIYYGHLYSGQLYEMKRTVADYKHLESVADQVLFAADNNIFPRAYSKYRCEFCPYKRHCFSEDGQVKY